MTRRPLILDVDGTLIRSDLTHEMMFAGFTENLLRAPALAALGLRSKPALKEKLVGRIGDRLAVEHLPLEPKVVALAKQAVADGREVYLCSGSEQSLVKRLAATLDFVTDGFGTTPALNLTSDNKAAFLRDRFPDGFDYVGNSTQDYAVWEAAHTAIAIRPPRDTPGRLSASGAPVQILEHRRRRLGPLLRAMRPVAWLAALPVFGAPLVHMGRMDGPLWQSVAVAFVALVLLTGAAALLNGLRDVQGDRLRPGFSGSPLAAGLLSVPAALSAAILLLLFAFGLALARLPLAIVGLFALYLILARLRLFRAKPGFGMLTLIGMGAIALLAGLRLVFG